MAEAAPRIVFCGSTTLDTIYRVPVLPTGPGKILPTAMAVVAHGMAASAATAAARLGAEAHLISRLGDDETGRRIVAELEGEGVRCGAVRRFEGLRSPLCTVLVDEAGERLVVPYYDPAIPADPGWLPLGLIDSAAAVQTDVRWPTGAALVLDRARAAGIPAVLDADVGPVEVIADLASRSSHVVFSELAALAVSGTDDPWQALARLSVMFKAFVAVTIGPGGCLWQQDAEILQARPPEVEAVDTLAAGDVFHGVFTWALARREPVEQAIRLANLAAAHKCTVFGGRLGAPRRTELDAMLQDGAQEARMAQASDFLTLSAGDLELDLVPAIGGSVAALRSRGTDIFRPLSAVDRAAANVLGVGMFPMVPYANRIADNAVSFRGRTYRVEPNNPPERFNVHGTGWHRAWTVASQEADSAVLVLEETGGPWSYRAEQHVALTRGGLTVGLRLANTGREAMPFGFGLHPWFPRDGDVTLAFRASRFHPEEADLVAGAARALPPELDFAVARPLPDFRLNNDFGGWSGEAVLRFPARGVELVLSAEPVFGHLMIYADPERPFFCVEPQSNAACAFNRGDVADPQEGIVVLEPGQEVRGEVRFAVRTLAG